ncbi:hypothetical protein PRUPE_8G270700 [Prunus persica]|uniref:Uncharacterized protein n=1 Tax=Prunus persica TaxID=3760 RepID=A0A251N786_PRUPE|nr:hypothetical protein PRUPE_8G270700 [Prunus persica]
MAYWGKTASKWCEKDSNVNVNWIIYNFQKWLAGPANLEVKFLEHNWISVLLPQVPIPSFHKVLTKQLQNK